MHPDGPGGAGVLDATPPPPRHAPDVWRQTGELVHRSFFRFQEKPATEGPDQDIRLFFPVVLPEDACPHNSQSLFINLLQPFGDGAQSLPGSEEETSGSEGNIIQRAAVRWKEGEVQDIAFLPRRNCHPGWQGQVFPVDAEQNAGGRLNPAFRAKCMECRQVPMKRK